VRPKAFGPEARSQNIRPVHLIRAAACADGSKKLLRTKKNESWAMRLATWRDKQVRLSELSWRKLLCEIVQYVFQSVFQTVFGVVCVPPHARVSSLTAVLAHVRLSFRERVG